jgi:hypothetical protein
VRSLLAFALRILKSNALSYSAQGGAAHPRIQGPFSLAHLRSQEALFRRVRRFKELRIWRTGASEAADSVLLSAAFGDAQ